MTPATCRAEAGRSAPIAHTASSVKTRGGTIVGQPLSDGLDLPPKDHLGVDRLLKFPDAYDGKQPVAHGGGPLRTTMASPSPKSRRRSVCPISSDGAAELCQPHRRHRPRVRSAILPVGSCAPYAISVAASSCPCDREHRKAGSTKGETASSCVAALAIPRRYRDDSA